MDVIQKVFSWCEHAYEGIEECSSKWCVGYMFGSANENLLSIVSRENLNSQDN